MTRKTDPKGNAYARARLYQTLVGLGFAALGVLALYLGHDVAGSTLIGAGMALVPMRTVKLRSE